MSANPPGVDELDPARLATDELEQRFAEVDGIDPKDDLHDLPPAEPTGHHQTHGVPVDAGSN